MIRTRFSPSPTGLLHLGNARAALFSALFAKKSGGHFILRIEDTDAARSEHKFTELLQQDLHWLGIEWQEGPTVNGPHAPYFQSQRHAIYTKYYQQLEQEKLVYPCFCTDQELLLNRKIQLSRGQAPRYPGTCRKLTAEDIQKRLEKGLKPALRFIVPSDQLIEFTDLIKGQQRFNSDDIGDFLIRRADGSSSFLFSNAVDDSLMEVTHVIRGEDHLANTPRQLLLLQALKLRASQYGHLSLILGDEGGKLSKRQDSFSLHDLREQGYLPLAALNYLARLSHTYDSQELMSFDELASKFQLERISRAPARFDMNQLLFWQKMAVMALSTNEAWKWLGEAIKQEVPEIFQQDFVEMMRANVSFPKEAEQWVAIFFADQISLDEEKIKILKQAGEQFFIEAENAVRQFGVNLKSVLDQLKNTLGISGKHLFLPIRIALTGEHHGPELAVIAKILGQEKMLQRFQRAYAVVSGKEYEWE